VNENLKHDRRTSEKILECRERYVLEFTCLRTQVRVLFLR